jgi:hypothetical protein
MGLRKPSDHELNELGYAYRGPASRQGQRIRELEESEHHLRDQVRTLELWVAVMGFILLVALCIGASWIAQRWVAPHVQPSLTVGPAEDWSSH